MSETNEVRGAAPPHSLFSSHDASTSLAQSATERAEETMVHNDEPAGFSFENTRRNEFLMKKLSSSAGEVPLPKKRKTGTTIVGVIYKDGVVLGADTRATEDTIVADKNCEKIHYIAPNIYCCGAGTAADTESVTGLISSQLELHRLSTGRQSRVVTAMTMLKQMLFRYQGYISAALVLGGVDISGPVLYTIWPHGSVDKLPYVTMGSGSLAAMAMFEAGYKKDMELEEAKALVHSAIKAGITNDLGSGSNVDLCVITKEGVEQFRTYEKADAKYSKAGGFTYPRGTTAVTKEVVKLTSMVEVTEGVAMEM